MSLLRRLLAGPSAVILIGLIAGQGAVYAATPIIARLYTPSEVGLATLFIAAATTTGTVGIMRLDQRIASCEEDELSPIVRSALALAVLISLGSGVGWYVLIGHDITAAVAFSLTAFALGISPLASQLASRSRYFRGLGTSKALSGGVQATSQTGLGLMPVLSSGLLLGYAAGYWAGLLPLWGLLRRAFTTPSRSRWISRRTLRICLEFSVASLINSLVVAAIPILMATFYSSDAVGQYSIAQRIAVLPAGLVVAALTPVIAAGVGERLRSRAPIRPVLSAHLRRWGPAGILVCIFPWLIPSHLVTLILGSEWAPVTTYIRVLSPMIATQLVIGPITQVLMMTGRSRTQLLWDASRLVLVLAVASAVASLGGSAPAMAASISAAVTAFYLILALLAWRYSAES